MADLRRTVFLTHYAWYDGAVTSSTSYKPDIDSSRTYTSIYNPSPTGIVNPVSINDGRPRTVTHRTDLNGQVLRRDEADGSPNGDPHEVYTLQQRPGRLFGQQRHARQTLRAVGARP